ncbi:hypothetical protein ANAPC5_01491 [Anaplasma phagocytophilum]|nr:hypothetical protein ANAPC5_01491 [Anaplasma phagocytophilum]
MVVRIGPAIAANGRGNGTEFRFLFYACLPLHVCTCVGVDWRRSCGLAQGTLEKEDEGDGTWWNVL